MTEPAIYPVPTLSEQPTDPVPALPVFDSSVEAAEPTPDFLAEPPVQPCAVPADTAPPVPTYDQSQPVHAYGAVPPAPLYGQPYGPPAYGYGPAAPVAPTSNLAIWSLVLSLVWVGGLTSLVGLFLGIQALKETKTGQKSGGGLAIAGIVISAVGLLIAALSIWLPLFIFFVAALASA